MSTESGSIKGKPFAEVVGTVRNLYSDPSEKPCICCGPPAHCFSTGLEMPPGVLSRYGGHLPIKNVGDWLHEQIRERFKELGDKRVRVVLIDEDNALDGGAST